MLKKATPCFSIRWYSCICFCATIRLPARAISTACA